jgi:hypothetical protein
MSTTISSSIRKALSFLAGAGVVVAASLATATPAHADISAPYRGSAMESVYCDSVNHTVQVTFSTEGEATGAIGGSDLFPYEENGAVWVTAWVWVDNGWISSGWQRLNSYGNDSMNWSHVGTSYWYFEYAFATPQGGWDYGQEWAGGNGNYGWYSNQNGYHSLTSCVS